MAVEENNRPNLDDVIDPVVPAKKDPSEHAKFPERHQDAYLEHLTEQERVATGIEDYDHDDVPPATGQLRLSRRDGSTRSRSHQLGQLGRRNLHRRLGRLRCSTNGPVLQEL